MHSAKKCWQVGISRPRPRACWRKERPLGWSPRTRAMPSSSQRESESAGQCRRCGEASRSGERGLKNSSEPVGMQWDVLATKIFGPRGSESTLNQTERPLHGIGMRREGDSDPAGSGFATVASGLSVSRRCPKNSLNFGHRSFEKQKMGGAFAPPIFKCSLLIPKISGGGG